MREIEIKARVLDVDVLQKNLANLNIELSKPKNQHDVVYAKPGSVEGSGEACWLRIRTEDDTKHIFTLKKSVRGHLDSIEHETEIADPLELRSILLLLGFELYSDLVKTRQTSHVGDIELCFDRVEGLGIFVEAEKLVADSANHVKVESELWGFFSSIGVLKKDEVLEGYDVLDRRAKGL